MNLITFFHLKKRRHFPLKQLLSVIQIQFTLFNMHSTNGLPSQGVDDDAPSRGINEVLNIVPNQLSALDVSKSKVPLSDADQNAISSLLSTDDCGSGFQVVKPTEQETLKMRSTDNRIVHGNQTRVPWQVFIRAKGESHVTCGGALINRQWILTAAHCDVEPEDSVFIGLINVPSIKEKSPYQIDRTFEHPEYDSKDSTNDFTLIKLKSPVRLSSTVHSDSAINTVCLPASGSEFERIEGWVSGYGHIRGKNGPYSPYLLSTRVTVLPDAMCNKITMDTESYKLDKSQMCASGTRVMKGKDVSQLCQGDSGGPLTVRTSRGKSILIGIVSFAYGICSEPGFFGKVSHATDWIASVLIAN